MKKENMSRSELHVVLMLKVGDAEVKQIPGLCPNEEKFQAWQTLRLLMLERTHIQ